MSYDKVLLNTLLSTMTEGVLVVDRKQNKILLYNETFKKMWHCEESFHPAIKDQDLLDSVMHQLVNPEAFMRNLIELYDNPTARSVDNIEMRDGTVLERRSEPFGSGEDILGRIFYYKDITEEYRSKELLGTQKSFLEDVLENIPYCIYWTGPDLKFLGCNQRFADERGFTVQEIIGQDTFLTIKRDDAIYYTNLNKQVFDSGVPIFNQETEVSDPRTGTSHCYLSSRVPLRNARHEITGVLCIYTDITELKENHKKAKDQEALLQNISHMSSLGEMAGGIAHEINNPLSIIKSSTRMLTKVASKPNFDRELFEGVVGEIDETVDRIAKIITGLKNITRNAEVEMHNCNFRSIFDDVLSIAQEKFRASGIEIRKNFQPAALDAVLMANRVQLSQVLVNLLNNSFDALADQENTEQWIELGLSAVDQRLILTFTDGGPGIPEAVQQKMFNPFFTTKEIGKGTGIGLSISKSMIEKHGGIFYYDSAHGNTRFVIELPSKNQSAK